MTSLINFKTLNSFLYTYIIYNIPYNIPTYFEKKNNRFFTNLYNMIYCIMLGDKFGLIIKRIIKIARENRSNAKSGNITISFYIASAKNN